MMQDKILRNRKVNRLRGYDYANPGYYFVTVCAGDRIEYFGEIKDGTMVLNTIGKIVEKQWVWLAERYAYVRLDQFVVMPNHLHGILSIVGNGRDRSLHKVKSLSELIGAFKTTSSKLIHKAGSIEFRWQKSFHDHIIRDQQDLIRIQEYVVNNPLRWKEDEYFQ